LHEVPLWEMGMDFGSVSGRTDLIDQHHRSRLRD
jgi:hypothetical protein